MPCVRPVTPLPVRSPDVTMFMSASYRECVTTALTVTGLKSLRVESASLFVVEGPTSHTTIPEIGYECRRQAGAYGGCRNSRSYEGENNDRRSE